jgi:glycosyltransferase involved in cell wall biosynthesis
MTSPFFSIVMAAYNPGNGIRACVDSINRQTCDDYELLISDGGSTDGTVEFIQGGTVRNLSWYRSGADRGIYDALNRALPNMNGQWMLVIGADDRLASPSTLDEARSALKGLDSTVGLVYGDLIINSSGNKKVKQYPPYETFKKKYSDYPPIHHQSAVIRADVVRAVGDFRCDRYGIHADYDFICRSIEKTAVSKIGGPLVEYSDRGYSSRIGNLLQSIREVGTIRSQLGVRPFPPAYASLYARQVLKMIARKGLPHGIYAFLFRRKREDRRACDGGKCG